MLPERSSAKEPSPQPSGPLILPIPDAPADTAPAPAPAPTVIPGQSQNLAPEAVPPPQLRQPPPSLSVPAAPATPVTPARQSALHDPTDITGSLPRRAPLQAQPQTIIAPAQAPADTLAIEKLPATIGGPTLRAAALAGNPAAAFEVATRFAEGHGVPQSNEQAVRWLERAANQGLAPAQFRLGGLYEKGVGVKKDLAQARDLYLAAANKGNGKAMHNLAVLYAEGINGPADYRTAAHWFRKAADRGITDSQYNLAILYARGVGVEQNYAEILQVVPTGGRCGRQRRGEETRRSCFASRPAIARGGRTRGAEMVRRSRSRMTRPASRRRPADGTRRRKPPRRSRGPAPRKRNRSRTFGVQSARQRAAGTA